MSRIVQCDRMDARVITTWEDEVALARDLLEEYWGAYGYYGDERISETCRLDRKRETILGTTNGTNNAHSTSGISCTSGVITIRPSACTHAPLCRRLCGN